MTAAFVKDFGRIPMSTSLASTLARAAEYASLQAHVEVTLEHLLLALTEDEDAEVVLATSNVNVGQLKSDVAGQLGTIEERLPLDQNATAKVSAGVMRILEAAAQAAQGRRNEINGAIVLAAIVGDGNSVAANLLRVQGLTFEAAIKALQSTLSAPPRPADVAVTQRPPVVPQPAPPSEPKPVTVPGAATAEDFLARARAKVQSKSAAGRVLPPVDDDIGETDGISDLMPDSLPASVDSDAREVAPQSDPFGEVASSQQDVPQTAPPPPPPPPPSPAAAPAAPNEPAPDLVSGDTWAPANPAQPPARVQQPFPSRPPPPPPLPGAGVPPPQRPSAPNPGVGQRMPAPGQVPLGGGQQPQQARPNAGSNYPGGLLPAGTRPVSPSAAPNGSPPMPPWPAPDQQRRPMPAPQSQAGQSAPANARAGQYPPQQQHRRAQSNPVPGAVFESAGGQREERAVARPRVEAGQLVENVPRTMQVDVPTLAEVSIAGASVTDLAGTLQGGGPAHRHDLIITKAMSVRLRAPDGGFFIETASPETQWIDRNLGIEPDEFARWRWNITPKTRGRKRLQVIVSARTVGADGLAAETALPDQVIEVKIRSNYKKNAMSIAGWTVAAVAGGLLARFGENIWETGRVFVASIMAGG